MKASYKTLKAELATELVSILNYWSLNTIDEDHGGFVGKIDFFNNVIPNASKGVILNTRILWSFSASSNFLKTQRYKEICNTAFSYLETYFKDKTHKGVFWELDYKGQPINTRKQVYAQVFTIYALSEYYMFSKNETAKSWAVEIFNTIETYAKDNDHKGYFEAFNGDWSPIEDMRLSNKDLNASKTMNTHLHILEAYTSLLKIHNSKAVKASLKLLVELFFEKFLNADYNFELFFDNKWRLLSNSVSFGHDIEAEWLIIDATRTLGDKELIEKSEVIAIKVADNFLENALNADGAVMNEKNRKTGHTDDDLHWWPQVEALIGLDYAYKLTNNQKYINASLKIWAFTKKNIIDTKNGEWHFRVDKNNSPYTVEHKVSMWKAPYHNSRACIILNS